MSKQFKFRLTGRQHLSLKKHLFPGDGNEAVALALCGVGNGLQNEDNLILFSVHKIEVIPHENCYERTPKKVIWPTQNLYELLKKGLPRNQVIVKIHSHPTGFDSFSEFDDKSDRELFTGLSGWLDTDYPGISALMLPDGRMVARVVKGDGSFINVDSISVVGADIQLWYQNQEYEETELNKRAIQTFGKRTTQILSRLCIGVVGVSGTGSPVVEMLYRLGVGKMVLVDADIVEKKNIGRIYNSSLTDALERRRKVSVLESAIKRTGIGTQIIAIPEDLFHPKVVRRLSQCDIIFGCMDSIDGRDLLNKLCTFYSIPYFDVGVYLNADGHGGVDQVCGTVHYLQPDGSSLFSRRVYTLEDLQASNACRTDPESYKELVRSKYIKNIEEESPAVISVNTLIASYAVNDFLARIHPFRDDPNCLMESTCISLTQNRLIIEPEGNPCTILSPNVGRGDVIPLLNLPSLSERIDKHD